MRPLKELILPLIHLSLLEPGTICCDDRRYLLTVYLFTQRNLLLQATRLRRPFKATEAQVFRPPLLFS